MKQIYSSTTTFSPADVTDKIHYACGRTIFDGWTNVDGFDISYPYHKVDEQIVHRILQMDLTKRHPFPDNTFRFGFSEDFLEHLTQPESLCFLAEAYRTFRKGGVLRLSFPGLRGVLRRHFRKSDHEGAATGVREAYTDWNHAHFYCEEEIELVARHIGFGDVRFCTYGQTDRPEFQGRETRPDQADLNIVVELTK